ncbi:hypothetical protein EGR_01888 [Echinococcus granulosus]|uniref:C2H2-type domain-containing protein n=1 Tax=Echinococcus granulosus TaxID=6210 RepID=W6UXT4_ECHGR|nr:hypothetical protein EGR_01888 [Echinococcus granulosus]EUB63397.1 hypothetical protein EGR_01888 [Echinococcus granulosus]
MPKESQNISLRFSVETVKPVEPRPIHHCRRSYSHPKADFSPDPVLSLHADTEVLIGKKPWPAVSPSVVETEPTVCVICGVDFKTRSGLHTHLSHHKHLTGKVDKYKKVPLYECKLCAAEVNCTTVLRHRCFVKHIAQVSEVETLMNAVGSPLVCIFCRGRILPSRAHLIAHLVSAHSPHRNPLKCVFCCAKFKSDNLLMQEMHVFIYHVPELIFLNRLAYFKEIKTSSGLTVDAKAPFLCLYDPSKTEISSWIDAISVRSKESWILSDRSKNEEEVSKIPANHMCYKEFKNLAEYTAHVYCNHAVLPHSRDKGRELNSSELRQLDAIKRGLPGPSVRELMVGSVLSAFGKSRITQTNPSEKLDKSVDVERKSLVLRGGWNKRHKPSKSTCRVCLHDYENEEGLTKHIEEFHVPETRKRVQHLADVGEMVHIIVSHGGKSWCNCGLCDQQFCEPNQCLPAFLTVGPALIATEDENQSKWELPEEVASAFTEPPSVERFPSFEEDLDALYSTYEAKLPTVTLCRILDCHEVKHYTTLQSTSKCPFLPVKLINQLLESRGHQGKQIFDWLSNISDQSPMMDMKPFVFDDPNSKKGGKGKITFRLNPGEDPLSQEGVEMGQRMLEVLVSRIVELVQSSNSDVEEEVLKMGRERSVSEVTQSTNDTSLHSLTKGSTSTEVVATAQKSGLPRKLIKLFTRIGEHNVAVHQEKEFTEKV